MSDVSSVGTPVEYKVLVLLDKVEQKTAGGIYKPDMTQDRELLNSMAGVIVAVGGMAFEDWRGTIPEVGDRIMFAKNAGYVWKEGEDDYRVILDKEIVMIVPAA